MHMPLHSPWELFWPRSPITSNVKDVNRTLFGSRHTAFQQHKELAALHETLSCPGFHDTALHHFAISQFPLLGLITLFLTLKLEFISGPGTLLILLSPKITRFYKASGLYYLYSSKGCRKR